MALLKRLSWFSPRRIWTLPRRAYLFIVPFFILAMSFVPTFLRLFGAPGDSKTDRNTRKDLQSGIKRAFKHSALSNQDFLPDGEISRLVTTTTVRQLMPGAKDDLVEYVCKNAKKIFLTTLFSDNEEVHAAMRGFYTHRMADHHLPIEDPKAAGEVCTIPTPGQCHHKEKWPAFSSWMCCDVSSFYRCQWTFCVPVFGRDDTPLFLEKDCILPFTWKDSEVKGGRSSTVCRAKIHADHYLDFPESTEIVNGEVEVALKELKHLNSFRYNAGVAWASEVKALSQINQLHLKHLIRRTGAFKKGERYYIMFEWGDGGSLRDLWQRGDVDCTELNSHRIMKVLEQLHGMAEALSKLHDNASPSKNSAGTLRRRIGTVETIQPSPSSDIPKIEVPVDDENADNTENSEEHWRLGDLKPENIISFTDATSPWLGTLKIANLGVAKQHTFATFRRVDPTQQGYSTSHYEGPEVIAKRYEPRTRLYDIWSMGCIIFEFVIWLLYGYSGLQKFYREKPPKMTDTLYFTVNPREDDAQVSDIVKKWMDHILQFDPECNRSSPSALGDLIRLVKDHLLVVALPRGEMVDRTRGNADLLENSLRNILEKAKEGDGGTYLFTRSSRKEVQTPNELGSLSIGAVGKSGASMCPPLDVGAVARRRQLDYVQQELPSPFLDDSSFATMFLKSQDIRFATPSSLPTTSLCESCAHLTLVADGILMKGTFSSMKALSETCQLHDLILRACALKEFEETSLIEVRRVGPTIKINDEATSVLSICRGLAGKAKVGAVPDSSANIPIGLPQLPHVESAPFYDLMRHWLRDCDLRDPQCRPLHFAQKFLPTRVLDVSRNSVVHLLETKEEHSDMGRDLRYIALSHPWGDGRYHNHFCTTPKNLHERLISGIAVSQLPQTFKDAVQVAQALDIRYLWIDSLCIIQGVGGDFHAEAKSMESIFSSAYCVIAASRATGTSSGFLGERPARQFFGFDEDGGAPHYICEGIDNFQHDVVEGDLNKRGWVFQERALARRTIYFTQNQTYWDTEAAYLGDPNFPDLAIGSAKETKIRFYEKIYERYSRLDFTKVYDRPIAIAGIEQRLVNAFDAHGGYGVFEGPFFGRSLLWIRDARVTRTLKKINFPPTQDYAVPTWSWMAYEGAIAFMDVPFGKVEWEDGEKAIRSPWVWSHSSSALAAWHTGDSNERIDLTAYARDLVDLASAEKDIIYDQGRAGLTKENIKCIIVGRSKVQDETTGAAALQRHYVLLVVPRGNSGDEYERVGAASLPETCIAWERPVLRVQIF